MKRQILSIALSAALAISMLAGCATNSENTPSPTPTGTVEPTAKTVYPLTVTDMTGREVTIKEPVTRIVAITAANAEIVYALGLGDTMVGRGEYCDYPAEVLEVASVGSGNDTNIEQIISLKPQVVFMGTMAQTNEQINQLTQAGIAVVASDAIDIAGTYKSIALMGKILNRNEEAAKIIENMKTKIDDIGAKASAKASGKSIYFEVSPLEFGLWTAGSNTFMDEAANILGLKNTFGDISDWAEISEEQVLERNPDYIMTVTMYFGEGLEPVESIKSRPGWNNVKAVANNGIINMPNNELTRPGPRLADGVEMLYNFVYGGQ
ncbi:vitamin B12-binding protein precursor [Oxobacter pfennigii]|uniref:Vitamin B12-binding protein n=1 Tax=Oxobacter pfennigii TaxID=36849 RepID=A0A0P8W1S1_9CLOT|nr:ABC transporter substrate-binding protein [Oxobacter pfennigii]KPU42434.1 vitamin B12-binding protein precursor [Oxobacter pfennigii]